MLLEEIHYRISQFFTRPPNFWFVGCLIITKCTQSGKKITSLKTANECSSPSFTVNYTAPERSIFFKKGTHLHMGVSRSKESSYIHLCRMFVTLLPRSRRQPRRLFCATQEQMVSNDTHSLRVLFTSPCYTEHVCTLFFFYSQDAYVSFSCKNTKRINKNVFRKSLY